MVSVIIPVFNTARYLRKCLDSICDQTLKDIEIIIINDGSTDESGIICDEYLKKDSRIKVIHKENGGIVRARKAGLEIAAGEFVGFVDSDDWIEPTMYERLLETISSNEVDISMCGRFEDHEYSSKPVYHGIPEGKYNSAELKSKVFPHMIVNEFFFEWGIFPSYWDKLFRKGVIDSYLSKVNNDIVMGEDAACIYPCVLNTKSIYVMHECLYHYRQSSASMVRRNSDPTAERRRFYTLYSTVLDGLKKDQKIFDLSEQWKRYLLFLMTPRADVLYENMEELEYLYPFPKVKKGSSVVIYGAGLWGQRLFKWLKQTDFCDVVAVADQNFENIKKDGFEVISPDGISCYEYDAIIVTASYSKTREAIIKSLTKRYTESNIYGLDEEEVFSDKTMRAFGLIK